MSLISIVVPFLNEAETLPALYERVTALTESMPEHTLELILVDDGSTDMSVEVIRKLHGSKISVRLVRLSRNFGSHAALAAGVAHSTGNAIAFISADLQDPPEIIIELARLWREGNDIVWATRDSRADPLLARTMSRLYYELIRRFALPQMPIGGVDLCLVDRRIVQSLGDLQERNSNIFNLLMWAGYRQAFIGYHRQARTYGQSKWSLTKKIKLLVDSFVAFSFLPIRMISYAGVVISLAGISYAGVIICRQLMWGAAVEGWSSIMVAVLVASGLNLLMLGILSEYLWRSLDVSRNRPAYLIKDTELVGFSKTA